MKYGPLMNASICYVLFVIAYIILCLLMYGYLVIQRTLTGSSPVVPILSN